MRYNITVHASIEPRPGKWHDSQWPVTDSAFPGN